MRISSLDDIFSWWERKFGREDNEALIGEVSDAEIEKADFEMNLGKAPGADGMTAGFY